MHEEVSETWGTAPGPVQCVVLIMIMRERERERYGFDNSKVVLKYRYYNTKDHCSKITNHNIIKANIIISFNHCTVHIRGFN